MFGKHVYLCSKLPNRGFQKNVRNDKAMDMHAAHSKYSSFMTQFPSMFANIMRDKTCGFEPKQRPTW